LPKGVSAKPANLICWAANGIPIIVIANKMANTRWVKAIQKPPNINQKIFRNMLKQPPALSLGTTFCPKGANPKTESWMAFKPKGIPTIVQHISMPAMIYSKNIKIPPKMIQIIFPIMLISIQFTVSDYNVQLSTDYYDVEIDNNWSVKQLFDKHPLIQDNSSQILTKTQLLQNIV